MAPRIATVLFVLCSGIAIVILGYQAYSYATNGAFDFSLIATACGIWLLGWAARLVMTNA